MLLQDIVEEEFVNYDFNTAIPDIQGGQLIQEIKCTKSAINIMKTAPSTRAREESMSAVNNYLQSLLELLLEETPSTMETQPALAVPEVVEIQSQSSQPEHDHHGATKELIKQTYHAIPKNFSTSKIPQATVAFVEQLDDYFMMTQLPAAHQFQVVKNCIDDESKAMWRTTNHNTPQTYKNWKEWVLNQAPIKNDQHLARVELKELNQWNMKADISKYFAIASGIRSRIPDLDPLEFEENFLKGLRNDLREKITSEINTIKLCTGQSFKPLDSKILLDTCLTVELNSRKNNTATRFRSNNGRVQSMGERPHGPFPQELRELARRDENSKFVTPILSEEQREKFVKLGFCSFHRSPTHSDADCLRFGKKTTPHNTSPLVKKGEVVNRQSEEQYIPTWANIAHSKTFDCTINSIKAIVHVDDGCTGLVLSSHFVTQHQLNTIRSAPRRIAMANGQPLTTCNDCIINFHCAGYENKFRCAVLPIEDDIILGIPFLQSILVTHMDWKNLIFQFTSHNQEHIWMGRGINRTQRVSSIFGRASQLTEEKEDETYTKYREEALPDVINDLCSNNSATPLLEYLQTPTDGSIQSIQTLPHVEYCTLDDLEEGDLAYPIDPNCFNNDGSLSKISEADLTAAPPSNEELQKAFFNDLNTDIQEVIRPFLNTVFKDPPHFDDIPVRPGIDQQIDLKDDAELPKYRGLRKMSALELAALKAEIAKLEEKGYIRRSKSQYGHNVLFVKKHDGGLRMCIDYRPLNQITKKNMTPQLSHTDVRHRVQGKKFFSKFDVKDAFFMIRMHPDSIDKTAFKTPLGLYEYLVCPFGATNSPPCFSTLMFHTFKGCDSFVINHMDDLLGFSDDWKSHMDHIKEILQRLQDSNLHVKLSKCELGVTNTTFCSMAISGKGIDLSAHQIEAVCEYPQIRSVKEIQQFLGLVRFFADFCPWLAEIAHPLFDLTSKTGSFKDWNTDHQTRVRIIQFHLSRAPTLHFYDPNLETFCATDASDFAIGGWLGQIDKDGNERVISYWSRRLIPAERAYPVHEREFLALVCFIKKFRIYLYGTEFTARVDHKSMEHLQKQPELSDRQTRWINTLQDYMPNIQYIKGPTNTFADWLSRRPDFQAIICPGCNHSISKFDGSIQRLHSAPILDSNFQNSLKTAQQSDPLCMQLARWKLAPEAIPAHKRKYYKRFSYIDGLWLHQEAIVVPTSQRQPILQFIHGRTDRGHYGFCKSYSALRRIAYWPHMDEDLQSFIDSCTTCQLTKSSDHKRQGLLHPLPIPDNRFLELSFDFKPLPESNNNHNFAWVITDRFTKLMVVIPCRDTLTSEEASKLFYQHWYLQGYGFPDIIVSDRDPRFVSKIWTQFSRLIGFQHHLTTARHQQANGQAESSVKILLTALRQQANARQTNWDILLPTILFAYNNSIHSSTGYSPFYLAFAFEAHTFPLINRRQSNSLAASFSQYDKDLCKAHSNIARAQDQSKRYYDRAHYHKQYAPGDLVLLERAGINLTTDNLAPNSLLQPWLGPFQVQSFDSTRSNVTLTLPNSLKCHNEFHVSHIRPWKAPNDHVPPAVLNDDGTESFEVESIVDFGYDDNDQPLFRVRWDGFTRSHDTWEPWTNLLNASDKVNAYLRKNPSVKFTLPPRSTGSTDARGGVVNSVD